jgi:hypothetical protein
VLLAAIRRLPWAPGTHSQFPPGFQAAVRAVLLAPKRSSSGATTLGSLPQDTLLHIVKLASAPMTMWAREDATVRDGCDVCGLMQSVRLQPKADYCIVS